MKGFSSLAIVSIEFIKDKFNPSRPIGRKNYFWSFMAYMLVYIVIAWNIPGMDQIPAPPATAIAGIIISLPIYLLNLRRARACLMPVAFIYGLLFLAPINLMTDGSPVEHLINFYGTIVGVYLLFAPNKVDPLSP